MVFNNVKLFDKIWILYEKYGLTCKLKLNMFNSMNDLMMNIKTNRSFWVIGRSEFKDNLEFTI